MTNPLEWFTQSFCSICKEKSCQHKGGGIYITDWNAKLMCALSAGIMLEIDRQTLKKLRKL